MVVRATTLVGLIYLVVGLAPTWAGEQMACEQPGNPVDFSGGASYDIEVLRKLMGCDQGHDAVPLDAWFNRVAAAAAQSPEVYENYHQVQVNLNGWLTASLDGWARRSHQAPVDVLHELVDAVYRDLGDASAGVAFNGPSCLPPLAQACAEAVQKIRNRHGPNASHSLLDSLGDDPIHFCREESGSDRQRKGAIQIGLALSVFPELQRLALDVAVVQLAALQASAALGFASSEVPVFRWYEVTMPTDPALPAITSARFVRTGHGRLPELDVVYAGKTYTLRSPLLWLLKGMPKHIHYRPRCVDANGASVQWELNLNVRKEPWVRTAAWWLQHDSLDAAVPQVPLPPSYSAYVHQQNVRIPRADWERILLWDALFAQYLEDVRARFRAIGLNDSWPNLDVDKTIYIDGGNRATAFVFREFTVDAGILMGTMQMAFVRGLAKELQGLRALSPQMISFFSVLPHLYGSCPMLDLAGLVHLKSYAAETPPGLGLIADMCALLYKLVGSGLAEASSEWAQGVFRIEGFIAQAERGSDGRVHVSRVLLPSTVLLQKAMTAIALHSFGSQAQLPYGQEDAGIWRTALGGRRPEFWVAHLGDPYSVVAPFAHALMAGLAARTAAPSFAIGARWQEADEALRTQGAWMEWVLGQPVALPQQVEANGITWRRLGSQHDARVIEQIQKAARAWDAWAAGAGELGVALGVAVEVPAVPAVATELAQAQTEVDQAGRDSWGIYHAPDGRWAYVRLGDRKLVGEAQTLTVLEWCRGLAC